MNTPRRHVPSGFTLAELLVVVAVVGILAVIAVPSFRSLTQSQQIKTASFELFANLNLARSEAIKRNSDVTLAPVAGGWQAGWNITSDSGETIKAHGALKGVVITGGPTSVVYARTGRITGAAPSFQIDTGATATANARCIRIDLSGMPRTAKGACS